MARIVLFVISFVVLAVIAAYYITGGLTKTAQPNPNATLEHVRQESHEAEVLEQQHADEIQKKMEQAQQQ